MFVPLSVAYFCSCYNALAMGWRMWGSNPGRGKRFFSAPTVTGGPLSFPFGGYRVSLPGRKAAAV